MVFFSIYFTDKIVRFINNMIDIFVFIHLNSITIYNIMILVINY